MSILTSSQTAVSATPLVDDVEKAHGKRFWLFRFFAWYRKAAFGPVTDEEKADWQKTSF